MTDTGRVFGLFGNGKAEWVRWLVAVAIGAGVTYAGMQSRLAVLESQMAANTVLMSSLASDVRDDMRELRTAIYAVQPLPRDTQLFDLQGRPIPTFPRDQRFGSP